MPYRSPKVGGPRRICVLNGKGGVGKSTTAVNLAVALAARGLRVLLLDVDAQGNATEFLGLEPRLQAWGAGDFLLGRGFKPVRGVLTPGLDLVPGSRAMGRSEASAEGLVAGAPAGLRRAVDSVAQGYGVVLADCGPSLGRMAVAAVAACPEVLVPVQLAPAAVSAALSMQAFLRQVAVEVQPRAGVLGVVGTFAEVRQRRPVALLESLRHLFGPALFRTVIHTSAAVRDAAGRGRPVVLDAPKSRGAQEYQSLAEEVVARGPIP